MAQRLSRDEMLLHHAKVASLRGTCSRLQVGAVFARDGRIIATGYNGTPKGRPHCNHECNCSAEGDLKYCLNGCASKQPCLAAQHAERNGIDFAARHGLSLIDSELYATHMPCEQCAGSLLNVGIASLKYITEYRLTAGVEMLIDAGVQVLQVAAPVDRINPW